MDLDAYESLLRVQVGVKDVSPTFPVIRDVRNLEGELAGFEQGDCNGLGYLTTGDVLLKQHSAIITQDLELHVAISIVAEGQRVVLAAQVKRNGGSSFFVARIQILAKLKPPGTVDA